MQLLNQFSSFCGCMRGWTTVGLVLIVSFSLVCKNWNAKIRLCNQWVYRAYWYTNMWLALVL